MVKTSQAKVLMLIAAIVGALQGLITFFGGCISTYDKNENVEMNLLGEEIGDTKYNCGFIRIKQIPKNLKKENEKCDKSYEIMDRGWYSRVHKYCLECQGAECDVPACSLNGFGVILAYAIVCGAGWFLTSACALIALLLDHKLAGIISTISYIVFYIVFFGLFGAAWISVKKIDEECLDKACIEVRRQGKRSSREVLAYSICSFITILLAIICCAFGIFGLGKTSSSEDVKEINERGLMSSNKVGKAHLVHDEIDNPSAEKINIMGRDQNYKLRQLNNYIGDKRKLHKYADKKFEEANKDKSGALTINEFKDYILELMHKKRFPSLSQLKFESLLRRHNKDEDSNVDKIEFELLLFDIFIESRESLIARYAINKARAWKLDRVITREEYSEAKELENVLESTDDFNKVLEEVVRQAEKSTNIALSVDEVAEIVKLLCEKYKVPIIIERDLIEIMHDLGKDITEYDVNDVRMGGYASLCIANELLK